MAILHFQHFPNKEAEIRGETKFWGLGGLGAYESRPPKQNFVAKPLPICNAQAQSPNYNSAHPNDVFYNLFWSHFSSPAPPLDN